MLVYTLGESVEVLLRDLVEVELLEGLVKQLKPGLKPLEEQVGTLNSASIHKLRLVLRLTVELFKGVVQLKLHEPHLHVPDKLPPVLLLFFELFETLPHSSHHSLSFVFHKVLEYDLNNF